MGRWGEEEKKSKGLVGCFVWATVFALFSYWFYTNYPNLQRRIDLEKAMQQTIRTGADKNETELMAKIRADAADLGVTLGEDDLDLSKWLNDNNNFEVECRINYSFNLDLFITEVEVPYPIHERVVLVF